MHVLGLSTFKQRSYVSQMINNGAGGYLLKSAGKEEINETIQAVLAGKMFFIADINIIQTESASNEAPALNRREKEILQMIAEGLTTNDIAKKICKSVYR